MTKKETYTYKACESENVRVEIEVFANEMMVHYIENGKEVALDCCLKNDDREREVFLRTMFFLEFSPTQIKAALEILI